VPGQTWRKEKWRTQMERALLLLARAVERRKTEMHQDGLRISSSDIRRKKKGMNSEEVIIWTRN
jgi:hypothetical protein